MQGGVRAFVSYARNDGEAFALRLRARLEQEEPEITLWQDRAQLEGGVGWWKQITDALDEVEFLLLILTPAAIASPVVRQEWQYARQRGVCVYPIKGVPDAELDYDALPSWMRKAHFFELEREWATFVRFLKSPCQVNRVPFMAPDRPADLVERPKEFFEIRTLLLDSTRGDPVAITTALQGSGGFGKTTLAVALCHDDDVIAAYDDGILWVTLGKTPNLVQALTKLYDALTGERPVFVDAENAAFNLAQRLEGQNCLVVLDDVWDPAHLKPFLFRSSKCAHLITTRQFDVAAAAKQRVLVDEMTGSEAVQLLTSNLPRVPSDLKPFQALAARLGEWPLLLKLATSTLQQRLARGDAPERALLYLNTALDRRGVIAFDRNDSAERNSAVSKTIDVSLELLTLAERDHYRQLAIFPEDTSVPLAIVGALWGTDAFLTEQLVERMDNFGLLEFSLQTGAFRIHDALRAYIGQHLVEAHILHAKLVDTLGDLCQLAEPYAWKWIAYHLVGANRKEQLLALLLDPAWLQAKLQATDCSALIADYEHVIDDTTAKGMRDALRLSAHVLAKDKSQLLSQLHGRVRMRTGAAVAKRPWLRPACPSLTQAGGALVRTLIGHRGWVRALVVTPDGRHIISGSDDRSIRLWDFHTGTELQVFEGHRAGIRSLVTNLAGTRLVSGDADGVIRVWDLHSVTLLCSATAHVNDVCALALTVDGERLVTASDDRTIRVWRLDGLEPMRTLTGHRFWVTGVVITPSGQAVTASGDHTLKVWDLDAGSECATLRCHYDVINALAITPNGCQAISGGDDMKVVLWDLALQDSPRELMGHGGKVLCVAALADGKRAVSGSADCTIRLWDLETGREEGREVAAHTDYVSTLAATLDSRHAVSGSADHSIKVWAVDAMKQNWTYVDRGHSTCVHTLVTVPNSDTVISASAGGTIRLWSTDSGEQIARLVGHRSGVRALAVSADGHYCVSASNDAALIVWDLRQQEELHTLVGHTALVQAVALSPDGKRIVSGSADCSVIVWDLASGESMFTLNGHERAISAVHVTADGKHVVSSSLDRTVRVWDLENGHLLHVLEGHTRRIETLVVTADGRFAISGAHDQTVRVWDIGTGNLVRTLQGHAKPITALAVSTDGELVCSGAEDGVVKVWSLLDGSCWHTFSEPSFVITSLRVCNEAQRLVAASRDHSLRVWDLITGKPVAAFTAEAPLQCACVSSDEHTITIGDAAGGVHVLHLEPTM